MTKGLSRVLGRNIGLSQEARKTEIIEHLKTVVSGCQIQPKTFKNVKLKV